MLLQLFLASFVFCVASGITNGGLINWRLSSQELPSLWIVFCLAIGTIFIAHDTSSLWTSVNHSPNTSALIFTSVFAFLAGLPLRIIFICTELIATWTVSLIFSNVMCAGVNNFQSHSYTPRFTHQCIRSLKLIFWIFIMTALINNYHWLLATSINVKYFLKTSTTDSGHIINILGNAIYAVGSLAMEVALLIMLPALITSLAIDFFIATLFRIAPTLTIKELAFTIKGFLITIALSYACYLLLDQIDLFINAISRTDWSTLNERR